MKVVDIYTDGACEGNPGPGGWGVILRYNHKEQTLQGGEVLTTNNRMELTAAIKALESLEEPCRVRLYTDSVYVKNGICTWIEKWKRNNWRTAQRRPVKNQDLWKRLEAVSATHEVFWHWVKAHAGDVYNERADALARAAVPTKRT